MNNNNTLLTNESFHYIISSQEKTNTPLDPTNTYYIEMGNFNSPYDTFEVEVVSCHINRPNTTNGLIILTCENLAENGIFCRKLLNNNECILSTINTNDSLKGTTGIKFRTTNLRMQRTVIFNLRDEYLDMTIQGTDINITNETIFFLTLKFTPIST